MMRFILLICLACSFFISHAETIRVGVFHQPPYVIYEENNYSGLCIDLWRDIAEKNNLDYTFDIYSDGLGTLRALDFKEIDVSINPQHINSARYEILTPSQPFMISRFGVLSVRKEQSFLRAFIHNFFSLDFLRVVLLLLFIIFVFGTLLWLVERRANRRQFRPGLIGLFDGLWWSAVTMTTVGYGDKSPKTRMGRVIAMVWMFTAIIVISGFTATIASTLTVDSLNRDITSLDDLRTGHRIGTVYNSTSEEFLMNEQFLIAERFNSLAQATRALQEHTVDVVVYEKNAIDYYFNNFSTDEISVLPVTFGQRYLSFYYTKNTSIKEKIDITLIDLLNSGHWNERMHRYGISAW